MSGEIKYGDAYRAAKVLKQYLEQELADSFPSLDEIARRRSEYVLLLALMEFVYD